MFERTKRLAAGLVGGVLLTHVAPLWAQSPAAAAPSAAQVVTPAEAAPPDTVAPATQAQADRFALHEALQAGTIPMSADRAAELAVATAPSIKAVEATSARASEAAAQAFIAVYPRLDLEARYTRLSNVENPLADALGPACAAGGPIEEFCDDLSDPLLDQLFLQARVSYPLSDLFFKILPSHRASSRAADAERLNGHVEQHRVALMARESFYNYARAKASLAVARAALSQSEAQRHDVQALVAAGTLARVELMRADAVVASGRVAAARSEGALAVARTALASLLHQPSEQEFALQEDFEHAPAPLTESPQALLELAFQNRSEVKALRLLAEVHDTTASVHAADGLPRLAIGATAEYAKPNARGFGRTDWLETWAAFASLTWSPNDLASGASRADQARADRVRTEADILAVRDALRLEVTRAFEDYKASHAAMGAAQTGIAAAEESYRVRREQFRAGSAVATDVIDAEEELRRARLQLVNAAIDVRIAKARLDRAVER